MKTVEIQIEYFDQDLSLKLNRVYPATTSDEKILGILFAEFNNGSGEEGADFLAAKCRSMSVGDYIRIDAQWYRVEGMGWSKAGQDDVDNWFLKLNELQALRHPSQRTRQSRWIDASKIQYSI